MSRILVSLGGNALGVDFDELVESVGVVSRPLVSLLAEGHEIVVCHGNGPQVGMIKTDIDLGKAGLHEDRAMPLSECVAMSQSYIGYHLQNAIENQLRLQGVPARTVMTVVSRTLVDPDDPAFAHPTKPIGAFFTEEQAEPYVATGKTFVEDSGRGWREVVASPRPLELLESDAVQELVAAGHLVIAGGGGGIPVIEHAGWIRAIDAVIDKDLTSVLLAVDTGCDTLVILTGVEKVALDFGRPTQVDLDHLTADDAARHLAGGQFPPGSMGPKVEAAIDFVRSAPGRRCLITSLDKLREGLRGDTGTWIEASR